MELSIISSVFILQKSMCFRYVLQELVDTERDYVKDLGCVVEVSVCKSSISSNKQFVKKRKIN